MELEFALSLAVLVAVLLLLGYATWQLRRLADPMRVRMIDYHVVQLLALIVALLALAHLITLFTGQPFTGSRLGVFLSSGFGTLAAKGGARAGSIPS